MRSEDRARLDRLVGDCNTPAKVVWRAQIVLASADGNTVKTVARLTGKSKPCVWRWQARFAEGVAGLLRDKTRPPGRKRLPQSLKLKVLKMTANETLPNATHWSVRTISRRSRPSASGAASSRAWGQLQKAIRDYLDQHNAEPKPFVWTKPADSILANEACALSQLRIKGGNRVGVGTLARNRPATELTLCTNPTIEPARRKEAALDHPFFAHVAQSHESRAASLS